MSDLNQLIESAKVLVCVGSGGVGKTTIASALAYMGASQGRKVLVLTVDPSQRLKSTMGIGKGEDIVQVRNQNLKGELWASVINPKRTFDEFVLRASGSSETAKKLLNNKLYIQLSTTLSGSQEFTALEKLFSAAESGKYDLIVLDTPPTKHAIDFLEAPQKLSALFSESITRWFRDPEGSLFLRLVQTGTRQVLRALEILTGSEFMRELSEFFKNIESWQSRLEGRISDVHRLMVHPKTHFLLVSSLDDAKIKEARYFAQEIKKGGYQLSAMIINRAFPYWVASSSGTSELEVKMRSYFKERTDSASKVESSLPLIVKVPELQENISDMDGVVEMAELLSLKMKNSGESKP